MNVFFGSIVLDVGNPGAQVLVAIQQGARIQELDEGDPLNIRNLVGGSRFCFCLVRVVFENSVSKKVGLRSFGNFKDVGQDRIIVGSETGLFMTLARRGRQIIRVIDFAMPFRGSPFLRTSVLHREGREVGCEQDESSTSEVHDLLMLRFDFV